MLNIFHMGKLYNFLKEVFKARTLLTEWISVGEPQTSRAVPAFNSVIAPNTIIFLETVLTEQKQNITFWQKEHPKNNLQFYIINDIGSGATE